uniref:C3a anaphylatoxin chemotactic receptor-like isoform X2 n=1 Tax=Ciona intestinalis TaxID=7719 RepID=UPI000EF4BC21|nr:C3a anaphylatoxin chemotactic receptor-like isoform X2 [Ciona intestinalis]|eukprot:XP_026690597.1 C3a anaphylatoxin chemotactic receptor-like isoform X2 [Ciona intestinalis]
MTIEDTNTPPNHAQETGDSNSLDDVTSNDVAGNGLDFGIGDDVASDVGDGLKTNDDDFYDLDLGEESDKMGSLIGNGDPNIFADIEYAEGYEGLVYGEADYNGRDPSYDKKAIKPMEITLAIIYAIITFVGLIANGVVFFVIFAGREIDMFSMLLNVSQRKTSEGGYLQNTGKTVTAMYVVQLAIADSALLLTLPIFGLQKVAMNWSFGAFTCTLCHSIKFLSYYAGIFFLTAMSVDRYVAVAYSTKSHQLRTRRRTMIVCLVVWLAAGCMTIPILMYARTEKVVDRTICRLMFPGYVKFNESETYIFVASDYELVPEIESTTAFDEGLFTDDGVTAQDDNFETETVDATSKPVFPVYNHDYNRGRESLFNTNDSFLFGNNQSHEYTCSHKHQKKVYKTWLVVDFVVGFVLPFIVITISYVMIVKRLQTSEDKIANMTGKRTISMRKRVTRMVAVLVVCFVVCWLPNHLFTLAKIRGLDLSVTPCYGIEHFLVAFSFSNAAINPILYSFLSHNFTTRFRDSVAMARRRMGRKGSMATGVHQQGGTHSGDHQNFTKRLSNFVGVRRLSRGSGGGEVEYHGGGSGNGQSDYAKKHKFSFPLREIAGKRSQKDSNGYSETEPAKTENESRTNQTECTRVLLESRKETHEC